MGYADIDTVQGRIRWSKVAVAVNWEMLTTDRGARCVPDVRRFKDALELEKALAGELRREEREREQLAEARFSGVSQELVVELFVAFERVRKIELGWRHQAAANAAAFAIELLSAHDAEA